MKPINPAVLEIGRLHLEGNVIPHAWYHSPLLRYDDGKVNHVAILLLSDILYWYRPTYDRDEASGRLSGLRQKFAADKLQKNYQEWADQFGLTKRQVQDAVYFLKGKGLITVELRTITTKTGATLGNVPFLEPVAAAVVAITALNEDFRAQGPSHVGTGPLSRSNVRGLTLERETYTETTTETTYRDTPPNLPSGEECEGDLPQAAGGEPVPLTGDSAGETEEAGPTSIAVVTPAATPAADGDLFGAFLDVAAAKIPPIGGISDAPAPGRRGRAAEAVVLSPEDEALFDLWWQGFPKTVAKKKARLEWAKNPLRGKDFETLIQNTRAWTEHYLKQNEWRTDVDDSRTFIPAGYRFLAEEMWREPPLRPAQKTTEASRPAAPRYREFRGRDGSDAVPRPSTGGGGRYAY